MKTIKRFSLWFIAIMAITSVTNGVWAFDFTDGTLFYEILSGTNVCVVPELTNSPFYNPGNKPAGDITIPATVTHGGTTYDVIRIGWGAFAECTSLTSVTIPSSVTIIQIYVFPNCDALTAITVDAGNTEYASENGVLYNKAKTKLIRYPGGKTETSFNIPSNVTIIGRSAFAECASLTSVTIPLNVTTIDEWAFDECTSLTSITIPSNVTTIGGNAFEDCTSLTAITVDAGNTAYASEDGVLYNKAKTTLRRYPEGKTETSFNIPSGVTTIAFRAFQNCSSLTSVAIPESVTEINYRAFQNCTSLTSVTIPSGVTIIGSHAFFYCTSLTSVTISSNVATINLAAFYGCSSLTSVTVNWTTDAAIPTIVPSVFQGVTLSGVTLSVPVGTKSLYEAKAVWQDFNIVEGGGLAVSPATLNMSAAGETQSIAVNSVAAWTASSDRPWLTLSPANGTSNGVIQATASANAGVIRTATVTVKSGSLIQTVNVTQAGEMLIPEFVALDQTDITLPVGSSMQLTATVYPETDKVSRKVLWYSINKHVATVSASGMVTGISEGVTSILVVTEVGERRTQCRVRVVSDVSVNPVDKGLRVYVFNGQLHISLPQARTVRIYNVSGALVKEIALPEGDTSLTLTAGFYIVQLGTQVKKVFVK